MILLGYSTALRMLLSLMRFSKADAPSVSRLLPVPMSLEGTCGCTRPAGVRGPRWAEALPTM